jgi:hypothetical protein
MIRGLKPLRRNSEIGCKRPLQIRCLAERWPIFICGSPADHLNSRACWAIPVSDADLTQFLKAWPHEPGRINARQIMGQDGRPKLQIRLDLGVLQMEMEGRPDGLQPEGFDSLLEQQQDRLRRYVEQTGSPAGFVLTSDECRALREEAVQYYHRYVGLFALGNFAGVVRDTTRNLELFDLCRDFGQTELDRTVLDQFRPPVLMMRARSAAEIAIAAGQPKQALRALDQGLNELRGAFHEIGRAHEFESANEVQLLRGMRDALVPKLPASQKVELQERLRAALDAENYELAAILRDELRMME